MQVTPFLSASLLLCCALPPVAAAQQVGGQAINPPVAHHFAEQTKPLSVSGTPSTGQALRRHLINSLTGPQPKSFGQEPRAYAPGFNFGSTYHSGGQRHVKGTLEGLSDIYLTAFRQRERFRETGQPMGFERKGVYFRRDLYSVTKGLILQRLWDDRVDIGLYKRRFQGGNSAITGQAGCFGLSEALDRGGLLKAGRQVYVGVRFQLDRLF